MGTLPYAGGPTARRHGVTRRFGLHRPLRGLAATSAATVQLSAPVIAAIGGVILLSEDVTLRLLIASAATLGGVAIVLTQRRVK